MIYIVYTDGSDFKSTTRRLGIGGVLINPKEGTLGKELGRFSEELSREDILRDYGTDQCSNPFAEMVAIYEALKQFSGIFKRGDKIIFKQDYEGCGKWLSGEWKAKLPYIRKIKEEILDILNRSPWNVSFEWVKGHQSESIFSQDAYWNNVVDKLAKGLL